MLVAIVGIDGAGKSNVVNEIAQKLTLSGRKARHVDRWNIVGSENFPTARFLKSDVKDIRSCVAEMPNSARLLFLLWTMSMALLADRREWPSAAVVLLDGYWMKHAASEIAYGLDAQWVNEVVAGLPPPDKVIYLQLTPEEAWLRKCGSLVPYECGMDTTCAEESFLAHQYHIKSLLDSWSEKFGWDVVDASAPLSNVTAETLACLDEPAI
jgi:dTMP kinase